MLPQFRQRQAGVIVNVASSVTLKSLPMLAICTASKAAVNAFSECLALELKPFNVRTHLVLPGAAPSTRFGENAGTRMQGVIPDEYVEMMQGIFAGFQQMATVTQAQDVAEAVWRAATDASSPAHVAAGADAVALVEALRRQGNDRGKT